MEWASYSKLADQNYFLVTEKLLDIERWIEMNGGERLTDALYPTRRFEYPWVFTNIAPWSDMILDAGGGPAIFQYLLSKSFKKVWNIDLNQEWIDKVNNTKDITGTFGNLDILLGDISNLSQWDDDIFCSTTCISAIEHGDSGKIEQIINELLRVTRGPVLITVDVGYGDQLLHPTLLSLLGDIFSFNIPSKPSDIMRSRTYQKQLFEIACIKLEGKY